VVGRGGQCRALLCANMRVPSDEEHVEVLVTLLTNNNKKFVFLHGLLLLKCLASILKIRLHIRDANTSLFREE